MSIKPTLVKSFADMDWNGWADIPDPETFNTWIHKRISKKKGNYPSPRAMNMIKTHINKLFLEHYVSADDSFFAAECAAWDSIKVAWVLRSEDIERKGYNPQLEQSNSNVRAIRQDVPQYRLFDGGEQ